MKNTLIITITITILSACAKQNYPQRPSEPTLTTVITETVHDTTILLQPDTAILQALILCDSTGSAYLQQLKTLQANTRIHQQLQITKDTLTATTTIDSLAIYLTWKQRETQTTITKYVEVPVIKQTNIIKPWQKTLMLIGAAFLLSLFILLITRCLPR